jgi:tetratricopeptide (TPR) repeat protein
LDVIQPPGEALRFRQALAGRAGGEVIDAAWKALQPPEGFVGSAEAARLHLWWAGLLDQQLRLALYAGDLQGERGARMCDKAGWLLRELGLADQAGQLLQDGLQLSLEAACPELSSSMQEGTKDRVRQGLRQGLRSSLESRWQGPSAEGPGYDGGLDSGRALSKEGGRKAKFDIYEAMTTLEVYQLASWVFDRFGDHDTPSVATLLTNMGVMRGKQEEHEEALQVFQNAVRIREITTTLESPAGAVLKQNLGYTLTIMGDKAGAQRAYDEAAQIRGVTLTLGTEVGHRFQKARQDLARYSPGRDQEDQKLPEARYWKEACSESNYSSPAREKQYWTEARQGMRPA